MRHWRFRNCNQHLEFMSRVKWDIAQMFTPPKSKSPWEAMTSGSTGGWAAAAGPTKPTNPNDPKGNGWLGPVLTGAAGLIPVVGPWISAGMGAAGSMNNGSGFQGTDKGMNNIGSTLLGGVSGLGTGLLGKGIGQGFQSLMGATGAGNLSNVVGKAMPMYGGQPAVTGSSAFMSSLGTPVGGAGLSTSLAPGSQGLLGAFGSGFGSGINQFFGGQPTQGASAVASTSSQGAGATTTAASQPFTLANISKEILKGTGAMVASNIANIGAQGQPQLTGNRDEALNAMYSPDLVKARSMIKDLALANPAELQGPAADEWTQATLRQTRDVAARARQEVINSYSRVGKTVGKSSSLDNRLAQMDREQIQKENDWITVNNDARRLAALKMQTDAVASYYNVSAKEAVDLLSAEGYVNEIDKVNFLLALQEYEKYGVQQNPIMQGVGNVVGQGINNLLGV